MNKAIYFLHNKLGFFKCCLNEEKEVEKAYKVLVKYKEDESANKYFSYAAVYFGNVKKCTFDKSLFEETIRLDFSTKKICAPSRYDEILTQIYGEYMKLPKEEDRVTHEIEVIKAE